MAALTATAVGDLTPFGRYWARSYSVASVGAAAADEWFVTEFDEVIQILGAVSQATTAGALSLYPNKTAGTGTLTASNGSVSIESTAACTALVTVVGRL